MKKRKRVMRQLKQQWGAQTRQTEAQQLEKTQTQGKTPREPTRVLWI
jgi:hypothetical protein